MNQQEIDAINRLLNPRLYGTPQTLQEEKSDPISVISLITKALASGEEEQKKKARAAAQTISDPKMKSGLNALMDACPEFPEAEEEAPDKEGEGNEKEEGGEAKPEF